MNVELHNFEMEVTNILQMKRYDLTNERKNLLYQECVKQRGLVAHKIFHKSEKENMQNFKRAVFYT